LMGGESVWKEKKRSGGQERRSRVAACNNKTVKHGFEKKSTDLPLCLTSYHDACPELTNCFIRIL